MYNILEQDFHMIEGSFTDWQELRNRVIFITGATGFLGSLIVKTLDFIRKKQKLSMTLLVLVRDKEKAHRILGELDVTYIVGDLCNLPDIEMNIDYIIHCGAITKSKEMIDNPVEVIDGIVSGTSNILKLAHFKKVKSMLYLSSMEIYGVIDSQNCAIKEGDLGYIEIQNTRSSYPMGKRMAENMCYCYWREYGVPVKIARLAQTFGAGILDNENRIFAQIIRCIINKTDIMLHTDGSSSGNYCYTSDALAGMLLILLRGDNGEVYNITNESTCMTIKQMVEMAVSQLAHGEISVKYEIPKNNVFGYAAPANMLLSSEKLRALGWEPRYGLEEMYRRTIAYMLEKNCL